MSIPTLIFFKKALVKGVTVLFFLISPAARCLSTLGLCLPKYARSSESTSNLPLDNYGIISMWIVEKERERKKK